VACVSCVSYQGESPGLVSLKLRKHSKKKILPWSDARPERAPAQLSFRGSVIVFMRTQTVWGRLRSNNRKRNLVNRRLNTRAYLVNNLANRRSDPNAFLCVGAPILGQKCVVVQHSSRPVGDLSNLAYVIFP